MDCCLVQLDEPLLLTKVVLAVVTFELSASAYEFWRVAVLELLWCKGSAGQGVSDS